jgi:hypothetical protein
MKMVFCLLGLMVTAVAGRAATFLFTLQPAGTELSGTVALTAATAGLLVGDHDPSANPGGTRTKPGIFGTFGSTENVPVAVELTPGLSGPLQSVPAGSFQLEVDGAAGTVVLSGLAVNLLPSGPLAVPSTVTLTYDSFRTRGPDSLFIGGFPLTVPLGDNQLAALAAAQIGSAAGELAAVGSGLYDFEVSTVLLLSGAFESALGSTELPPVPVPYTLSGRVSLTGDTAMVTATSSFAFADETELGVELPSIPFPLPTILPAGGTANVVLDLALESLATEVAATLTLAAPGRMIPEPSVSLVLGGMLLAFRRRRKA